MILKSKVYVTFSIVSLVVVVIIVLGNLLRLACPDTIEQGDEMRKLN